MSFYIGNYQCIQCGKDIKGCCREVEDGLICVDCIQNEEAKQTIDG